MLAAGKVATYLLASALVAHEKPLEVDITELECMIEAIHFEARGESTEGKRAVASVILNRVDSQVFPDTICEVVHQKYQFSYRNNVKSNPVQMKNQLDVDSFKKTVKVSLNAVQGDLKRNTGGADHYLNPDKLKELPSWYSDDKITKTIGDHVFLKLYGGK